MGHVSVERCLANQKQFRAFTMVNFSNIAVVLIIRFFAFYARLLIRIFQESPCKNVLADKLYKKRTGT